MEERKIDKLDDLVGIANSNIIPAEDIDRSFVIYPDIDKDRCIKCGRCYLSCFDGGHQAYTYNEESREITLNKDKCVGCHLCSLVCPVQAINKGEIMFRDGNTRNIVI
jgi:dihydropyrimidine dehydrogenase (NAD+) subunit PreA